MIIRSSANANAVKFSWAISHIRSLR